MASQDRAIADLQRRIEALEAAVAAPAPAEKRRAVADRSKVQKAVQE